MDRYIVYNLIDPRNNKIFYVGKGRPNRVNCHIQEAKRFLREGKPHSQKWVPKNLHRLRILAKILEGGNSPIIDVVAETTSEELAYQIEKENIRLIGLDNLSNISEGGMKGRSMSESTRKKISLAHMGKQGIKGGDSKRAKLTWEEARLVRKRCKEGTPRKDMAEKYQVDKSVIDRIVQNRTYFDTSYIPPELNKRSSGLKADQKEQVIEMRQEGLSHLKIANVMGVSETTISRTLKQVAPELRHRGAI